MPSLPTINFSGLASGLDTNSIVTQLMAIERNPQLRLQQQQRVEQARQQALQDIQTRLVNPKTAAAGLRDAGTWGDQQTVEASDATKVTATRTGGAAAGGYTLGIGQLARAHQVAQGTALATAAADDVLHVSVGGGTAVDVAITAGDTIATIAEKINNTSGIGTYATAVNGKLVLSGKATGAANTISVTSDGSLATDLGLAETLSAQDAQYTLNGVAKTSATNTVTDGIVGVSLTLKATTSSDISINVSAPGPDSSAIQEKVQAFVDQYNSTLEFIRGKMTEKRVADPQTDADRAKGVLYNDSGLATMLGKLRSAVADVVGDRAPELQTLSQVGISTGASTGSGAVNQDALIGKLSFDSSKLTTALASNFNGVKDLFTKVTGDVATEGFGQRIDAIIATYSDTGGIMGSRIQAAKDEIAFLTTRSSDMDIRLAQKEEALRRQFTAMETAISNAQQQSAWLAGQLASLG
ncbi:MAG: flagellar filament capping protein FliD [Thermoleophilia bacterium]